VWNKIANATRVNIGRKQGVFNPLAQWPTEPVCAAPARFCAFSPPDKIIGVSGWKLRVSQ
jgi:hypothetical protein